MACQAFGAVRKQMFVLIQQEPKPDAPYWPGRRLLAALDAVAWPVGLAVLLAMTPATEGHVRPVLATATLWAIFRLCVAVLANERYRFTTWWCARLVALLRAVWVVMRLAMPA
jgi:hypothetical protein